MWMRYWLLTASRWQNVSKYTFETYFLDFFGHLFSFSQFRGICNKTVVYIEAGRSIIVPAFHIGSIFPIIVKTNPFSVIYFSSFFVASHFLQPLYSFMHVTGKHKWNFRVELLRSERIKSISYSINHAPKLHRAYILLGENDKRACSMCYTISQRALY